MRVRQILDRDRAAVTDALADAFTDDPVTAWIVGHDDVPTRRRVMADALFSVAAQAVVRTGQGQLVHDDDRVLGAALWVPPDRNFFGREDGARIDAALRELGAPGAPERARAVTLALHDHPFPDATHVHLQFIGVVAAARGRDLGASLLAPVLQRCDAEGLPAGLESSNPRNVSFYLRHGFEVLWEARPEGGPPLLGMWRTPR